MDILSKHNKNAFLRGEKKNTPFGDLIVNHSGQRNSRIELLIPIAETYGCSSCIVERIFDGISGSFSINNKLSCKE
jgi:hypothetical protein